MAYMHCNIVMRLLEIYLSITVHNKIQSDPSIPIKTRHESVLQS